MNPSAPGWISKFGAIIKDSAPLFADTDAFYAFLRSAGFIYGFNVTALPCIETDHKLTEEELAKTNLLTAFYAVYSFETGNIAFNRFIESLLRFHKNFGAYNTPFWKKLFVGKSADAQLEKYIHSRIQIDENLLTKNFSKLLINFLLFTDVLAYRIFLRNANTTLTYLETLEHNIINLTYYMLNTKTEKTKYHAQLVKLLKASLRYQQKEERLTLNYHKLISGITHPLEKKYMLDIAAMAIWEDRITTPEEIAFMEKFSKDLKLPPKAADDAITAVNTFYEQYKDSLPHLNNGHFVKNFYDNASKIVSNLIVRNKKRLHQELIESRELLMLLSKATTKELSKAEKQKVKAQLTDIFKAIPSLAIFALPGGAVLLPLFVKLIPKLLPSSFDDNRID